MTLKKILRHGHRADLNLRELKLTFKATEEFSPHGLRSVFRLLDEDGSKELSPAEVKKGLIQLGFQVDHRSPLSPLFPLPSFTQKRSGGRGSGGAATDPVAI